MKPNSGNTIAPNTGTNCQEIAKIAVRPRRKTTAELLLAGGVYNHAMQQEVGFDSVTTCCFVDDVRYCGDAAEMIALIGIAVAVSLALHPRVLRGALALVGEPPSAVRRMGVPQARVRAYQAGLMLLATLAAIWALAGLYTGPNHEAIWRYTRPAGAAAAALFFGATLGGLALLVSLAQHTLERRLGSGYASLLLGAAAIGAAVSVAVMDSLHILSLLAGAIVGAAIVSLYRAVDGLPWYAATAGCVVGAALAAMRDYL